MAGSSVASLPRLASTAAGCGHNSIKDKIDTASLAIAERSEPYLNACPEVGYAWDKSRSTVNGIGSIEYIGDPLLSRRVSGVGRVAKIAA